MGQRRPNRGSAGFTMVELVAVMMIVGILAAVALPRFFSKPVFDVRAYYDQAQAMLRFGQKLAVAQGVNVYVRLNGASVALCYDSACTQPVTAPTGGNSGTALTLAACGASKTWYCEAPASGVSYTSLNSLGASYNSANSSFYFSAQGRPYNTGDTPPVSNFNSQLTVTVTGSGASNVFYVERETGYVHH